ncbi:MAG TPA: hypothetical protein VGF53_15695 [Pseudolabrys sp.]|jgi:hypothetical protein
MIRVWDYIGFAVWFAGLGYIVLWLLGSPGHLVLPPGLHAVGVASATLVPVRLLLRAVSRWRGAAAAQLRKAAAILRPPRRKSSYPIRLVKARSHFGLRGVPH